jgi:uncharacterized protein YuzE
MGYKISYEPEADVLTMVLSEEGKVSYAQECEDIILHVDEEGRPLFFEVLHASKVIPRMVEALARHEASI